MFWFLYILISVFICFCITKLTNKILLKVFLFSLFFSLFLTVWFIVPGQNYIAPVIIIYLLENTILENEGLERLARPLILVFSLTFLIGLAYFLSKSKSWVFLFWSLINLIFQFGFCPSSCRHIHRDYKSCIPRLFPFYIYEYDHEK